MDRFQQLFNMPGMGGGGGAPDAPVVDTAEKLHISSLALLKMLKHGQWLVVQETQDNQVEQCTPYQSRCRDDSPTADLFYLRLPSVLSIRILSSLQCRCRCHRAMFITGRQVLHWQVAPAFHRTLLHDAVLSALYFEIVVCRD